MPKYNTLAELRDAYARGELTADDKLVLDNDCAFVYVGDEDDDECVYHNDYPPESKLLSEALTLIGIPHRNA